MTATAGEEKYSAKLFFVEKGYLEELLLSSQKLGAIQGEVTDKTPSAVSSHTALMAASPDLV